MALSTETQIITNSSTYGTRQSNKSDNGGGAVYGCRSKAGGIERGNEPCLRARNLVDGRAFEFENTGGSEVGVIRSSNANAAPFTTNAAGSPPASTPTRSTAARPTRSSPPRRR